MNGASKYYKTDAIEYSKELLQNKYPQKIISSIVAEEALQYGLFDTFEVPFLPIGNPRFTFIDLFAGIGGFRIALQNLGGKCIFTSEWDKEAKANLQGFPDNFNIPVADASAYKQFGISVAVPAIQATASKIIDLTIKVK